MIQITTQSAALAERMRQRAESKACGLKGKKPRTNKCDGLPELSEELLAAACDSEPEDEQAISNRIYDVALAIRQRFPSAPGARGPAFEKPWEASVVPDSVFGIEEE